MKKGLLLLVMIMAFSMAYSQEGDKYKITVGLNGGLGQNMNGYRLTPDSKGYSYYGINPHYSLGLDIGVFTSNRFRPRLEFRYVEMDYGMYWPDNYPEYDKSITTLYEMDLNLHFDYLAVNKAHFQVFISPAFVYEFVTGNQVKNFLVNGDTNYKNYNIFTEQTEQYGGNYPGGNLTAIAKYKINNYLGVTLSPGYTYFFTKFVSPNDKAYQRFSINLGIEIAIF